MGSTKLDDPRPDSDSRLTLELFLLSKMSNHDSVVSALDSLCSTPEEMQLAVEAVMSEPDNDLPVHPLTFFLSHVSPDIIEDIDFSVYGKKRYRYELAPWPNAHLTCIPAEDGSVSSVWFMSKNGEMEKKLSTVEDLQIWTDTRSSVEHALGPGTSSDGWEFDWSSQYRMPPYPGGIPTGFRLTYSLDLLQDVAIVD